MLLFKVINQCLVVGAKCCQAQIALYVGRMIPPQVLKQRFSIGEYLAAVHSVANYLRHVDVSQTVEGKLEGSCFAVMEGIWWQMIEHGADFESGRGTSSELPTVE